jgi:hypothetical protein
MQKKYLAPTLDVTFFSYAEDVMLISAKVDPDVEEGGGGDNFVDFGDLFGGGN